MVMLTKAPAILLLVCGVLLWSPAHARVISYRSPENEFASGWQYCGPTNQVVPCKTVEDPSAMEAADLMQFAVDKLNAVWAPLRRTMTLTEVILHESLPVAGVYHWLNAVLTDPIGKKWVLEVEVQEQLATLPWLDQSDYQDEGSEPQLQLELTEFKLSKASNAPYSPQASSPCPSPAKAPVPSPIKAAKSPAPSPSKVQPLRSPAPSPAKTTTTPSPVKPKAPTPGPSPCPEPSPKQYRTAQPAPAPAPAETVVDDSPSQWYSDMEEEDTQPAGWRRTAQLGQQRRQRAGYDQSQRGQESRVVIG